MGLLLDASVLIGYERRRLGYGALISGREDDVYYISVITVSELLHGVHRAEDAAVRARRSAWVEAVLRQMPVLEIDSAIARTHARLWADMATREQPIGAHDTWIAASAITHGLVLATGNVRHFGRVPGLQLEHWG